MTHPKAGHAALAAVSLFCAAATLLSAVGLPEIAAAQPAHEPDAGEKDTARKAMDEGDAAIAKKDYPTALRAYQGAHAIMNLPVTGIEVAKTLALMGQLLEAKDMALTVARMPSAPGESSAFAEARKAATELATSLDSRIPSIQITVKGLPTEVTPDVTIDSLVWPSAALVLPRRVNPGPHQVIVKAKGFADNKTDVNVDEKATLPVLVEMKLQAGTDSVLGPGTGTSEGLKLNILIPIGAPIAGVGLILGIGTGVAAVAGNTPTGPCKTKGCPLGVVSDIGFVIAAGGAAVTIAGVILMVTAPKDPKKTVLTVKPSVGPGYFGLNGTFD